VASHNAPLCFVALAALCGLALSCAGPKPRTEALVVGRGSALAVLGVSRDFKESGWEDERVGFGLSAYLAEALYGTGVFRLVEVAPELEDELRSARSLAWASAGGLGSEAERLGPALGARYLAYGNVISAGSPRSGASLGPLHARSRSTVIEVEVRLREVATGRTLAARGRGRATTVAASAAFDLREKEVALDKSTIGIATKEALRAAVGGLMESIVISESTSPMGKE